MPLKAKFGHIEADDLVVAEIISVSVTGSVTEEDTSRIGNAENGYNARTEVERGPDTITANCYVDPTDPAQAILEEDARVKLTDLPDGPAVGGRRRVYSEVLVISADEGERSQTTYQKVTYVLKQTGTKTKDIIT